MLKRKFVAPFIMLVFVLGGMVFVLQPQNAAAQALNQQSNQQENRTNNQDNNQQRASTYKYVAQPGDSYSKMARKAVQTYGLKNKVSLTQAQILFAETNLTKEANSPLLTKGQAVEINEDAVKGWVDKAKELSPEKQTAWEKYTAGVNFNTDRVGQSS